MLNCFFPESSDWYCSIYYRYGTLEFLFKGIGKYSYLGCRSYLMALLICSFWTCSSLEVCGHFEICWFWFSLDGSCSEILPYLMDLFVWASQDLCTKCVIILTSQLLLLRGSCNDSLSLDLASLSIGSILVTWMDLHSLIWYLQNIWRWTVLVFWRCCVSIRHLWRNLFWSSNSKQL